MAQVFGLDHMAERICRVFKACTCPQGLRAARAPLQCETAFPNRTLNITYAETLMTSKNNPAQTSPRAASTAQAFSLFDLPAHPEGLGSVGAAFGRLRLRTFIALRWLAIAGQTAAILLVSMVMGFALPLDLCLGIIALSAWVNIFLMIAFPAQRLAGQGEAALQLGFDLLQLTVLIGLTGGLANPFAILLIAPVTVGAATLSPKLAFGLATLGVWAAAGLFVWSGPLPWYPGQTLALPDTYRLGQLAAIIVGLAFSALSAWRVNLEEVRLARALEAAEAVLAREQRLSALGAMAAATAHELGTPLATIHLVAREMAKNVSEDSPTYEDAQLLASQAERCRLILRQLSAERETTDIVHANLPLSALLEEAVGPHKDGPVPVVFDLHAVKDGEAGPPIMARSPELIHALGAFVENAVSFANEKVTVEARWSTREIEVLIIDDGPGFSQAVLAKLGEPYISTRPDSQTGGGMGLGFFIAKTLLERAGGRLAAYNRPAGAGGAVVRVTLTRTANPDE
jgi:two-component system, sensor histidine kinase RegB